MNTPFEIEHSSLDYLESKKKHVKDVLEKIRVHENSVTQGRLYRILKHLTRWRISFEGITTAIICECRNSFPDDNYPVFGPEVAQTVLVLGDLIKSPIRIEDSEARRKSLLRERLRDFFNSGYNKNIDLILLCLAFHLVKLEELRESNYRLDQKHIQILLDECRSVYIPLTEMLGLWKIRRNLLQRMINLPTFRRKRNVIRKKRHQFLANYKAHYKSIKRRLRSELARVDSKVRVKRHVNNPGSVYYRSMEEASIRDMTNLLRINIVVATEDSCYLAVGVIHGLWSPDNTIPFRDMIASPKYNGYKALITTIRYPPLKKTGKDIPVEIRIFTREMEQVNEYGVIACNMASKENLCENAWWSSEDHFHEDDIHVFSPVGEVFYLPMGSTVLDYAYHVHSEIGNNCRKIFINGREALSFDQALKNGDLVEVEVEKGFQGPYEKWLSLVRTPTAKKHLSRAIRNKKRHPHKGRKILDKVLERETRLYQIHALTRSEIKGWLEKLLEYYSYSSESNLYFAISRGTISADKIVDNMITDRLARFIADQYGEPMEFRQIGVRFAKIGSRRVIPGMPIVGRIRTRKNRKTLMIVYGRDWDIIRRRSENLIPLKWNIEQSSRFSIRLHVHALSRTDLLTFLLRIIYGMRKDGLYLSKCETEELKNHKEYIKMTLNLSDHRLTDRLDDKLKQLEGRWPFIISYEIESLPFTERVRRLRPFSLPNPYTAGPACSREIFMGRGKDLETIDQKLTAGERVIVVYGPTRIGKTSLLQYLRNHVIRRDEFVPLFLDLLSFEEKTSLGFWHRVASQIEEKIFPSSRNLPKPGSRRSRAFHGPFEYFRSYIGEIQERFDKRTIVIMLDEFSVLHEGWDSKEARLVSNQIKSIVHDYGLKICFILCLQQRIFSQVKKVHIDPDIFDVFTRGHYVKLETLDAGSAERLVREPVNRMLTYRDDIVKGILENTACHPYIMQRILIRIVDGLNDSSILKKNDRIEVPSDIVNLAFSGELEHGDITFFDMWHKCRPIERMLLKLISYTEVGADANDIMEKYREVMGMEFPDTPFEKVVHALDYLHEEGLIAIRNIESGEAYSIHVPLFKRWLRETAGYC